METNEKAEETEKTPVCKEKDVNTKPLEKKSENGLKGIMSLLVIIIAINVVATLAMLYVYDRYYAQKIVAVDMKGFLDEQRDQFIGKKINEKQLNENMYEMEHKIKSMPKNKVMIMGEVVIGNAEIIKP